MSRARPPRIIQWGGRLARPEGCCISLGWAGETPAPPFLPLTAYPLPLDGGGPGRGCGHARLGTPTLLDSSRRALRDGRFQRPPQERGQERSEIVRNRKKAVSLRSARSARLEGRGVKRFTEACAPIPALYGSCASDMLLNCHIGPLCGRIRLTGEAGGGGCIHGRRAFSGPYA